MLKPEGLNLQLEDYNTLLDTVFSMSPIGIGVFQYTYADKVKYIRINQLFENIIGRSQEEIADKGWESFTHADDVEENLEKLKKLRSGEIASYSMEKRYIKPDGSIVWVFLVASKINLNVDSKLSYITLIRDITKEKLTEETLNENKRSKSLILSHLPGLAYRCNNDRNWTMQYLSNGCLELTGYPPESLLHNRDLSYNDIIAPEYRARVQKKWKDILKKRKPYKDEYQIITAKGEQKWVLEMGQGVYNLEGQVEALEGIILDISDRKKMEDMLRYNSQHDTSTGLYNRQYLESVLDRDKNTPNLEKRALVGINLSSLERLTMGYGFQYTEGLVKHVAQLLKAHITEGCQLFRTHEKRFVFYISDYKEQGDLTEFCKVIADTLESTLFIERVIGNFGVLEIDDNSDLKGDQILKMLLIVSEKSKTSNRGNAFGFSFYDSKMEAEIIREETIKNELIQILKDENDQRLFLEYQPILDLKTNKVSGFEALARLKSDKLGMIPPLEFIPIAEKTQLIIPLGERIFFEAFMFLTRLCRMGYSQVSVSINVSGIQLLSKDFIFNLSRRIKGMELYPDNIILEITESIIASKYDEVNNIIDQLKALGVGIAIDDFGTGYSSLARVLELNVNHIKIDKSFMDQLATTNPKRSVIGDIISMSHKLGNIVTAEGVENQKQKLYLLDYGCDKLQGYLFSKPLNEKLAINLLKEY